MKLAEFYNQVIKLGLDRDVRKLPGKNPFPDTALLYGDPNTQIRKIMVGVDIEVGELVLADRLREKEGLDLVISHHPEGIGLAGLPLVMRLQVDILVKMGLKESVASGLLTERMREVERRVIPGNLTRAVDAARLLDMPFMCMHTPADNHVEQFIITLMKKKNPRKIKDVLDILNQVPEYKLAGKNLLSPRIIAGSPNRPVGKILVEMTGGTEGNKEVFDKLYKSGVRTLISMHLSEEHLKKVKDANLNAVIAGHISSDNLGINLLLDRLEDKAGYQFDTINCSGFIRIRR